MREHTTDDYIAVINGEPSLRQDLWFYIQVGRIVGQVNSVEMYINGVIASYYGKQEVHPRERLKRDIVQPMTLDTKIGLVKKIAMNLGLGFSRQNKSDLYKWKDIRNVVAHGVPLHVSGPDDPIELVLVYNGDFYDVDTLTEEFYKRQNRLTSYLTSIQESIEA